MNRRRRCLLIDIHLSNKSQCRINGQWAILNGNQMSGGFPIIATRVLNIYAMRNVSACCLSPVRLVECVINFLIYHRGQLGQSITIMETSQRPIGSSTDYRHSIFGSHCLSADRTLMWQRGEIEIHWPQPGMLYSLTGTGKRKHSKTAGWVGLAFSGARPEEMEPVMMYEKINIGGSQSELANVFKQRN